ncbi:MAG: hypothetical protein GEU81_06555 [Nitriliruptorales bacterium]|nr:hypothetical protein [Nitriliruptorales bacterium]
MTGTFGGALEARDIPAGDGRLRGEAVGEVEKDGRVLVLKRIRVTYRLALDPDADREKVDRVMQVHPERCPVYRSIHPQIEVSTALEMVDA